jgi:ElaB/YqjD/DUF883 family membrane-anchored ribosome-binding protein
MPVLEAGSQLKESNVMSKQTQAISDDMGQLADDARALVTATASDAKAKVGEARQHLATAAESGKALCGRVRDKAIEGGKAADEVVRGHPYQAIGIAFGVGALIGDLLARRYAHNGD